MFVYRALLFACEASSFFVWDGEILVAVLT